MADNPFAFPFPGMTLDDGRGYPTHPGMTLRDWFAGRALAMLPLIGETDLSPEEWAHDAYAIADAMLAERSK